MMSWKRAAFVVAILAWVGSPFTRAQSRTSLSASVREFVSVDAPVVALTHVRVIDGTGAAASEDQTIVIRDQRIAAMGASSSVTVPSEAKVVDLRGFTVIPGLVGMHEHLFYPAGSNPPLYPTMGITFPRLYLALGVTTARTGGSMEPYLDQNIKRAIDKGEMLGPKIHLTGPYLEGAGSPILQLHRLSGPEEARKMVDYWADLGFSHFKAYQYITHDELQAAIEQAHKRGLKLTGHLCSVGLREAAELGIDNLEHGWTTNTEYTPGKTTDVCPARPQTEKILAGLDIQGTEAQATIRTLVQRRVAVTSTLVVSEPSVPNRAVLSQPVLDSMSPQSQANYLIRRLRAVENPNSMAAVLFKKEMEFERAFSKAGGLLMSGLDPTGNGGAIPGFGDLRNIELLVEAGLSPLEAIKVATSNGAEYLRESSRVGTLATGKQADIVVIHGNPAANISEIEKVETVFKDGIGYDSVKLIASVRGAVGLW
jgi:imidazolonepropionase-like amidohydrolase